MKKEEKKVIIPLDEYQELLKDSKDLASAKEELAKDSKERGFYVERHVNLEAFYGPDDRLVMPRLKIVSKDEALKMAQEEIDRISQTSAKLLEENANTIQSLKSRNLWDRIFNR